jgi:L-2-hydroxycarboxylate dehydrogenase (NAD+)
VLAQSPELVAPAGGTKPVFGTNPICVAIPGPDDGPLILDMATAAITFFGLITSKANRRPLPVGCAVGPDGNMTTDPDEALKGALLAFGGHKGSGLSLIVELLGGVLPGGAFPGDTVDKKQAKNWGNLVIAFDPSILMDRCRGS